MRTKFKSPYFDETLAFIVFILCIVLSFFNAPVEDMVMTFVK